MYGKLKMKQRNQRTTTNGLSRHFIYSFIYLYLLNGMVHRVHLAHATINVAVTINEAVTDNNEPLVYTLFPQSVLQKSKGSYFT